MEKHQIGFHQIENALRVTQSTLIMGVMAGSFCMHYPTVVIRHSLGTDIAIAISLQ